MKNYEIQRILISALPLQEVFVSGDEKHFQITAIGEIFEGMSLVQKQQVVYAPLMEYFAKDCIHALSIKTYTPKEWETLSQQRQNDKN